MMQSSGSTCEAARSHLCLAPYLYMSSPGISGDLSPSLGTSTAPLGEAGWNSLVSA